MDLLEIRKKLSMGIPITKINLKVTDYSRVSTESKMQQNSLENQVSFFKEYIKSNPNWTYIQGYSDLGISGVNDKKRQSFMNMINDAKNKKFDLIITKEISRFSRNTLDSIKYTRMLLENGVAVFFVNDNINTIYPDSELRLTIMASMAQDEIRRLSERVKFGMHEAIKKGVILGHNHLYGYSKNKITGNLEVIEREKQVVEKIFKLYANENVSLRKIAQILNEDNILSKTGKNWCSSTIMRMIKNPKYKGYYCGKKSEVIDYMTKKVRKNNEKEWVKYKCIEKIPPIINEKLWKKANKKLINNRKNKY